MLKKQAAVQAAIFMLRSQGVRGIGLTAIEENGGSTHDYINADIHGVCPYSSSHIGWHAWRSHVVSSSVKYGERRS